MSVAKRFAEIMAGIKAGTFRFAPPVDPVTGVAAWPPGWRPAPWKPAYEKLTPEQLASLARGRSMSNQKMHKAGPLSKRAA